MPVPTYSEIMLPLLQLTNEAGTLQLKEAPKKLRILFKLTPEESSEKLNSGQNKLNNRMYWASWYLKECGLIEPTEKRGYIRLTGKAGKLLKKSENEIEAQLSAYRKQLAQNNKLTEKSDVQSLAEEEVKTPDEVILQAYARYQDRLKDEVLQTVKSASPEQFEEIVIELMEKMGYGVGKKTPKTHDGGIDGKINEDVLGLGKIYLQAKRWDKGKVTEKDIRDFIGALTLAKVSKGVFITSNDFYPQAIKAAENFSHGTIRLINGKELAALMVEYGLGVQSKISFELKTLDKDYFES